MNRSQVGNIVIFLMYSFPKFIIGYAFVNDSKIVYCCKFYYGINVIDDV